MARGGGSIQPGSPEIDSQQLLGDIDTTDYTQFTPETFSDEGEWSIWLPQFELRGAGSSFDEAVDDLVDDVRDYVNEYRSGGDLAQDPSRAQHAELVEKAHEADKLGQLAELLLVKPEV